MPSAHMAKDGQFGFNIGVLQNYQRYAFWFQALPWLEGAFRYSRVPYWAGERVYYDRSFSAKLRLLNEDDGLADISLGVRDLFGTGVYSGDYIVASRHLGDFDFTGGIGWGRLSSRDIANNPLGEVFSSFNERQNSVGTGVVSGKSFFHGKKVGAFGGVVWQTPLDDLSVIAEYSSDKYSYEANYHGGLKERSPINVGLSYHPLDTFALSAGWYYGTTYGVVLTLSADPRTEYPSAIRVGPELPPPAIRTDEQQQTALNALSQQHRLEPHRSSPSISGQLKQTILETLRSGSAGVRDVEVSGRELLIDARATNNRERQCANYAQLASASSIGIHTVVVSDLQSLDGRVTVCQTQVKASQTASRADNESPAEFDQAFFQAVNVQSLQLDSMWISGGEIWVYYENYYYGHEAEAVGRIARLLMVKASPQVEVFHIIPVQLGVPQQQVTVVRSTLERAASQDGDRTGFLEGVSINKAPMVAPIFHNQVNKLYPLFSWSLDPKLSQHMFDPDKPLQFMIYADAAALLQLSPGLLLSAEFTGTLWSDYTFSRDPGSALPHVRTDLLEYLDKGKYGISGLQLIHRDRLRSDVFTEVRAGYLEDMFAGFGGQVLWRPEKSRFAFGANIYQVWQRDYNRLFGLKPYQVLTGHVSAYYESPWYDLNFAVHAGQYLAGDRGATFQITRRFSSGIEIGAWVTFTNVSSQQFGEGSFDKGIIIHIPFEWGLPIHSQSSYDMHMSSLTRDGGQRLGGDDSLFETTRQASYGELQRHQNDVIEP
jgi:hypothetical protein